MTSHPCAEPRPLVLSLWRGVIPQGPVNPGPRERTAPMSAIGEAVGDRRGVTVADIRGPILIRYIAWARQEFYYLAREAGHSTPAIGRWCGGRDHTTVIYGAQSHAARLTGRKMKRKDRGASGASNTSPP